MKCKIFPPAELQPALLLHVKLSPIEALVKNGDQRERVVLEGTRRTQSTVVCEGIAIALGVQRSIARRRWGTYA
jgi:hypothetical protein